MKRRRWYGVLLAGALLGVPGTASAGFGAGTFIREVLSKVQQAVETASRPVRDKEASPARPARPANPHIHATQAR